MDFNVAIQILSKSDIWNDYVKDAFLSEMINSPDELRIYASKLWDYRSNKFAHARSHLVVYTRETEIIVKGYYQILSRNSLSRNRENT